MTFKSPVVPATKSEMSISWGLQVTKATLNLLVEVTARVGNQIVWTSLFGPIPDDKREAYIAEITALVATVAMSDAKRGLK